MHTTEIKKMSAGSSSSNTTAPRKRSDGQTRPNVSLDDNSSTSANGGERHGKSPGVDVATQLATINICKLTTNLAIVLLELTNLESSNRPQTALWVRADDAKTLTKLSNHDGFNCEFTAPNNLCQRCKLFSDSSERRVSVLTKGDAAESVFLTGGAVVLLRHQLSQQAEDSTALAKLLIPVRDRRHLSDVLGVLTITFPQSDNIASDTAMLQALNTVLGSNSTTHVALTRLASLVIEDTVTALLNAIENASELKSPACVTFRKHQSETNNKMVVLVQSEANESGSCASSAQVRVATLDATAPVRFLFAVTSPTDPWQDFKFTTEVAASGRVVARTSAFSIVDAYSPSRFLHYVGATKFFCPTLPEHTLLIVCVPFDPREFVPRSAGLLHQLEQCSTTNKCRHVIIFTCCAPAANSLADMKSVREMLRSWTWFKDAPNPPLFISTIGAELLPIQLTALRRARENTDWFDNRVKSQKSEGI